MAGPSACRCTVRLAADYGKFAAHCPAAVLLGCFVEGGRIGVVPGFIKKTQKTPEAELELAHKRMKEMKT